METIKHALELVKSADGSSTAAHMQPAEAYQEIPLDSHVRTVELSKSHLNVSRIVAHRSAAQGLYYDVLRTQVLQEMDRNGWQFLGVTAPTRGSGATLTACNLAMSLTRLPDRSVALIDMDLQKPSVAAKLGIKKSIGLPGVLRDKMPIPDVLINASIDPVSMLVLGGDSATNISSDWMASQTAHNLFEAIRRELRSRIVIFDLPPLLSGDDIMWILPRLDAIVLVVGSGKTTVSELDECGKYIQDTQILRVVLSGVAN